MIEKQKRTPQLKWYQVWLVASILIIVTLGVLLIHAENRHNDLIEELCGNITLTSITASTRLDEAVETNDRRLALIAGNEIMQLSGVLNSYVALEMGVQNTYGPGSLSSMAELIIWGDSTNGVLPIGRPDDKTVFSEIEISIMEQMAVALNDFALSFYTSEITVDTYMHEQRSRSDISAVNSALRELQQSTKVIFESLQ